MIAITGHTDGLGLGIFQRYAGNAIGFSRRTGYDIASNQDRARIVEEARHCDVFINNAYADFAQIDLLYAMHDTWTNTDKLIINISSNSGDGIKNHAHRYAICKSALDKASEQLSRLPNACRITNLRPGYIDTPRVSHVTNSAKVSISSMVDMIDMIINSTSEYVIPCITILPR